MTEYLVELPENKLEWYTLDLFTNKNNLYITNLKVLLIIKLVKLQNPPPQFWYRVDLRIMNWNGGLGARPNHNVNLYQFGGI